jgi:hypothetical protein
MAHVPPVVAAAAGAACAVSLRPPGGIVQPSANTVTWRNDTRKKAGEHAGKVIAATARILYHSEIAKL